MVAVAVVDFHEAFSDLDWFASQVASFHLLDGVVCFALFIKFDEAVAFRHFGLWV